MRQGFTRLDKEEIIIIGAAGIMLATVLVLFSLLMASMAERENVLLRYEAEQTLADFLFIMQNETVTEQELMEEKTAVRGLGIYNRDGVLIFGFGQVPDVLEYQNYEFQDKNVAEYNKSTGLVEYIRRAKITLTAQRYIDGVDTEAVEELTVPVAEYLYISFDGSPYGRKVAMGKVLTIILFVSAVALFIFLWRIFKRNREYRKTLAQQESLVSMGEAARTLAHEIKNPLSALSLQAAVLKKTLPEEYQDGVRVIEQETSRLNSLTNRVGDFLRNPEGEPQVLELDGFIRNITERFPEPAVVKTEGQFPLTVRIDAERARSVFENLLKNAYESCEDTPAKVSVLLRSTKTQVIVHILDRGDGLPDGAEKQLFDPFYTTKIHGSGIGLAITRRFVIAAGGSITLRPREGGGTDAEIQLPRST